MNKEIISFRKTIKAGATETISERVKAEGQVIGLRVRFYAGQEMDLHVIPYIEHVGERMEHLITYPTGTNSYLAGDDDSFKYNIQKSVENDDYIRIKAENVSAYDYDLVVDVEILYVG